MTFSADRPCCSHARAEFVLIRFGDSYRGDLSGTARLKKLKLRIFIRIFGIIFLSKKLKKITLESFTL